MKTEKSPLWLPLVGYCTTDLIFKSFPQRCCNQCLICSCCSFSCLCPLPSTFHQMSKPKPKTKSMSMAMSTLGFLSVPKCTNFNESRTLCSWWRKADLLLQYTHTHTYIHTNTLMPYLSVYIYIYISFFWGGPLHNFSRNRDGLPIRFMNCGQVFNFVYLLFIIFLSLYSLSLLLVANQILYFVFVLVALFLFIILFHKIRQWN